MKRKLCIIEDFESIQRKLSNNIDKNQTAKMYRNTIWYRSLQNAEKTCLKQDKVRKIHYKFEDNKEMVEEYNSDTKVLLRRAWKVKGKLGGDGKWLVEVGDPIPETTPNTELPEIVESKDQPIITKRNTRINIEWRIRNLPYPIETYSVKADNENKVIIISTSNKKYYKKLDVPELTRLALPFEQGNIQVSHQFNTLIVTYKKPQQLLDMEKDWYQELNTVEAVKDIPNDCKTQ
ncbi:protein DPCD [Aricia agestis]|uniref:protein DPCD n=1 Tax=Aricia agestis TaxID=91739 RepID=UPI001C2043ED|nr:protein DPCD [Aricia agestis]